MFRRFESLDHFRGFAALWVVVFHAAAVWIEDRTVVWPEALEWFALNGWRGVQVFFVISGYCITERLARAWTAARPASRFLADRAWRIFPPYWAALAFAIALNIVSQPFNHQPIFAVGHEPGAIPVAPSAWLRMLTLTEPWVVREPYLLVSWTLTYELGYYLLAVVAFGVARALRQPSFAFALGALVALAGSFTVLGVELPALRSWTDFFLGALVWLLLRPNPRPLPRAQLAVAGLVGVLLGLGAWMAGTRDPWTGLGTAIALVVVHRVDAAFARSRALRALQVIGTFSFSLYLVHAPIVGKLRNLAGRWVESSAMATLIVVLACAIAIGAAWIFFVLVEKPSETMRRSILSRERHETQPAPA